MTGQRPRPPSSLPIHPRRAPCQRATAVRPYQLRLGEPGGDPARWDGHSDLRHEQGRAELGDAEDPL
jgi:hypothetical protein